MEIVSVIIPTVYKNYSVLQALVDRLEADDAVSEIIIINNTTKPLNPELKGSKLKIYTPEINLYVNKSWNFGVSVAENDIFLLINDDILCCNNFCSNILKTKILDNDVTGLVGLDNKYIRNYTADNYQDGFFMLEKDVDYKRFKIIEMYGTFRTDTWGSALFGRKKNYYPIPDELNIIYGDNYLILKNLKNGKINFMISNVVFNHIKSQTSLSSEFSAILQHDVDTWEKCALYFLSEEYGKSDN